MTGRIMEYGNNSVFIRTKDSIKWLDVAVIIYSINSCFASTPTVFSLFDSAIRWNGEVPMDAISS